MTITTRIDGLKIAAPNSIIFGIECEIGYFGLPFLTAILNGESFTTPEHAEETISLTTELHYLLRSHLNSFNLLPILSNVAPTSSKLHHPSHDATAISADQTDEHSRGDHDPAGKPLVSRGREKEPLPAYGSTL